MDRKAFYDAVRPTLGVLTQANVVGFELVLDEAHRRATRPHDLAYILATAWWESGRTMQPVKEAFWLSETWRRKNLRYYPFYGRGLVQLTWEANYRKASDFYGIDFVKAPDLVLEPKHSINILFDGMVQGWFTGKDVGDYIDGIDESDDEDLREFANARRVVNGVDRQVEIGKLALVFESALKAGGYGPILIPSEPIVIVQEPAMPAPAPIGHNGGPPLTEPRPANPSPTPVEQSSKAVGAGKWAALAAGIWQTIVVAGVLPAPYDSVEFSTAIMGIIATVAAIVGSYRAPQNAEPTG